MNKHLMKARKMAAGKKGGFAILTVAIIVIVLIALIAAFVIGGGPDTGTDKVKAKMAASEVMDQANALKSAFLLKTIDGRSISQVTWDDAADTGVFDTASGGIVKPVVSKKATVAGKPGVGKWYYSLGGIDPTTTATVNDVTMSGIAVPGMGDIAKTEYAVATPFVDNAVCEAINNAAHNVASIPTDTTVSVTLDSVNDVVSAGAALTVDSTVSNSAWEKGCYNMNVSVNDGNATSTAEAANVAYYVVKAE